MFHPLDDESILWFASLFILALLHSCYVIPLTLCAHPCMATKACSQVMILRKLQSST